MRDIANNDDARPTRSSYRSALSLPVGDGGVLQLISTDVGGFMNTDRELAELLVDHVEHGLERVRYEATLERERDRFAALFQNVPDAAVQYSFEDDAPRIEQVNSAFVRLFGFEPETAVGETTLELLLPEDGRETALERYDEIRDGDRLDVEVTRMTADGPNPFLLRSVPVSTENETQTGYLISTDIGELKERERQLERKNERLDSFASIVSHDIRNPLSVALGFLDLLETEDEERLEKITMQLERIDRMIDELLSLAREGEMIGETEPVALEVAARSAWEHVDTVDATITVSGTTTLEADRERVEELFENLFRKAREHAGDAVAIEVGTITDESGFYVADDGRGIPDEHKDDVLEMGVSLTADGTGYGLGIVSEIAAAHGWEITVVDSDPGGARFEIRTPED